MTERRTHVQREERRQRQRRDRVVLTLSVYEVLPDPPQSVFAVGLEHPRRETLPPILIPDVVARAHRVLATRVMRLEFLEGRETLVRHSCVETLAPCPHHREHFERVQTLRPPRRHERVKAQIGEDLTEPERRQS